MRLSSEGVTVVVSKSPSSREGKTPGRIDHDINQVPAGPAATGSPATASPPVFLRLGPAAVVSVLWVFALMTLAILTANPTTLNLAQITAAPLIVEATIVAGDQGEWRVSRSWPPRRIEESIQIQGLDELHIDSGQAYLIPVRKLDTGEYRIVLSPKPFASPFIYPANPQTVSELEAVLRNRETD